MSHENGAFFALVFFPSFNNSGIISQKLDMQTQREQTTLKNSFWLNYGEEIVYCFHIFRLNSSVITSLFNFFMKKISYLPPDNHIELFSLESNDGE